MFLTKKVISPIFFGKDLPLFLTKFFSKKQNCGLQKLLRISSKNELLLKQNFRFETYDSLRYKNIPSWYFYDKYYRDYGSFKNVQNITFYGVICHLRQVCLNMIEIKHKIKRLLHIWNCLLHTPCRHWPLFAQFSQYVSNWVR